MIPIDSQTVAAESFADLRDAINDSAITYIYFATNITLTAGITVPATKTSLTLDGFYPLDGSGTTHTLTDMDSIFATDTIGVRSASSIALTIKNLNITGRNYYGVPYFAEDSGLSGVVLTYQNVTYNGPQMTYNVYGTTRYIDCNITIAYAPDTSRVQEVGEVSKVELGGIININHTDTDDAVFYFRGTRGEQALTILEGANVTVNTASYFMWAAFYNIVFWDPLPVTYHIQSGATFNLNTAVGISLNATHQAASFSVDSGGAFNYTQARNSGYYTLYLNGAFTVSEGARVYMACNFVTTYSLIRFTAATSTLNLNNPKSCVFYSGGVAALSFAASMNFAISGNQLNYWRNPTAYATAGTFEDIPLYKWYKAEYNGNLTVSGSTSSTATSITTHNFTAAELGNLPAVSNLHLYEARVLSVGNLPLSVNPVVDDGTPISGVSDPNANIRVSYTASGASHIINAIASGGGSFAVATPEALPIGTAVTVGSNAPFLIIYRSATAVAAGELLLVSAPTLIRFMLSPSVSASPLLLGRQYPDEPVVVYDTRVYSTAWRLTATISGDLTTPSGYTLPNAVIYVDNDVGMTALSTTLPVLVYSGEASDGTPTYTNCVWAANRGILLHVTRAICNSESYTALLEWELDVV